MPYLLQGLWARIADWFEAKWSALKTKAIAAWQKLRTRNTGNR